MHVLMQIHQWLRPGGVLLDLHPELQQPTVEVAVDGIRRIHVGQIDTSAVAANIQHADVALQSLVEGGWFSAERSIVFDFVSHFPSVDEWLRHRVQRRSRSVVAPVMINHARELLSREIDGQLLVTERVLATRFKRESTPTQ